MYPFILCPDRQPCEIDHALRFDQIPMLPNFAGMLGVRIVITSGIPPRNIVLPFGSRPNPRYCFDVPPNVNIRACRTKLLAQCWTGAACQLADETRFLVPQVSAEAICRALDAPGRDIPDLTRLFAGKSVLESGFGIPRKRMH